MYKYEIKSFKDYLKEDLPSYKISEKGTETMTSSELLSLIIGSSQNALDIAKSVLNHFEGKLSLLSKADIPTLLKIKGISQKTASRIIAAFELGRRRQAEKNTNEIEINTPKQIYDLMHPQMMNLTHEEAYALFTNNSYKLIKQTKLSSGGITETAVDVRMIIKEAVLCNATALVLIHNHPSGNITPSVDDK